MNELRGVKVAKKFYFLLTFCALLLITSCAKQASKWEIVIHSRGGQIENNRLILEDLDQYITLFSVGKPRYTRSVPVQSLIEEWDNIFATSEPNATVSIVTKDGEQREQVMILKKPRLVDNKLEFSIDPLNSTYQGVFDEAVVFIDSSNLWGNPYPSGTIDPPAGYHPNISHQPRLPPLGE